MKKVRKITIVESNFPCEEPYSYYTGGTKFYAEIEKGKIIKHEIFLIPSCHNSSDDYLHWKLPFSAKSIKILILHLQEVLNNLG